MSTDYLQINKYLDTDINKCKKGQSDDIWCQMQELNFIKYGDLGTIGRINAATSVIYKKLKELRQNNNLTTQDVGIFSISTGGGFLEGHLCDFISKMKSHKDGFEYNKLKLVCF